MTVIDNTDENNFNENKSFDDINTKIQNIIEDDSVRLNAEKYPNIKGLDDDLFLAASYFCITNNKVSISSIQRKFGIGYIRAAHLVDTMESMGFVSKWVDEMPRKIEITLIDFAKLVEMNTIKVENKQFEEFEGQKPINDLSSNKSDLNSFASFGIFNSCADDKKNITEIAEATKKDFLEYIENFNQKRKFKNNYPEKLKIAVVTLGCDKNRVDTENMLYYLDKDCFTLTTDEAEAEILIVNTCGFIESAKKESIETILELAEYKNKKCKMLIATGCLVQRYTNELSKELVEVDAFLGTCNYENINNVIYSFFSDNNRVVLYNTINKRLFTKNRVLSTPNHFAYLKIAEGCDNKCTYCAIPKIRGNYTSRKAEELMEEAEFLVEEYGITELNIVAQDITRYGIDLYGEYKLVQLLNNLSTLDIKWIRLLYCYPELLSDELINLIATNDKICKYIDIPLQHVSDRILKLMNRRTTYQQIVGLITKIRKANPNICIRSTFIVGFPGETEQDFNELCNFIKEYKLDKCGFFAYSKEDGTPAEKLPNQIENNVKEQRKAILYALQYDIMLQKAKDSIGKIVPVIYENIDYEKQLFVGRTMFDAPIIDTNIYFTASFPLEIGKIYNVKITNNNDIDLIGEANEFTN